MPPTETQLKDMNAQLEGAKKTLQGLRVQPTVSASALSNPVNKVTVPEPVQPELPSTLGIVKNVARDTQGFISAQTEEAKRLKELQDTYGALSDQGALADMFAQQRDQFGGGAEALQELKDINLQLADLSTESVGTQSDIARAAGQTIGQGSREISAEQARNNVRSYGLAARAAVLQGNIETANTLARDAVNIAYQDRQLTAQNLINQINMVQGQVNDQNAQLLEQEKRQYEAELAKIQEVKDAVANAMVNGASQSEMAQLTDPNIADDQKIALAQAITARGANELRNAELASRYASVRASDASAAKSEAELAAINSTMTGRDNVAVQALDVFSGSLNENNREQYTKAITGAVNRGNVEQVEIGLKNAAQAAAGKALTEDVIKRDQAIGALKDVQSAISDYQKAGGNTNLLVGGYEDLQNRLGKTGDTRLAEIESRIDLALNSYTNAVSGASFTPQESARYAALFPSTSNTNQLNETKINTLLNTFEANNQVFYGNFFGGYTPSQIAEEAVYQELVANATPQQLQEAGVTQ